MSNIVEVNNLTTHYGNTLIHDSISFHVKKGEIFSILGGSGSGKTTLLHTLISYIDQLLGVLISLILIFGS